MNFAEPAGSHNLRKSACVRQDFVADAHDLIASEEGLTRTIEPLLEILVTMLREFAKLTNRAFDIVRNEPVCRLMMSAPGVGPLTALAFRATIDAPERFVMRANDAVCRFCRRPRAKRSALARREIGS
jgi:transposase